MAIAKKHLVTTAWTLTAATAFGLGWALKPQSVPSASAPGSTVMDFGDTGAVSALSGAKSMAASGSETSAEDGNGNALRGVALSSERIAELGARYRETSDPLARREAFAALIAGLTVDNALEIRAQFEHLDDKHPAFRDFHFAWGKIAGAEAVLHGADTKGRDMGQAIAGWASVDPAAAMKWFDEIGEDSKFGRDHLKGDLVRGLAIDDPDSASDFVHRLAESGDRRGKEMIGIVLNTVMQSRGATAAAEWAAALPEGDLRGHAMWDVARAQVRNDPEAAVAWATSLAGDKNIGSVAYGVSMEWGHRDGAANVAWLEQTGSEAMASAFGPALAGWTKADPLAASQHIANMAPSEGRDHAIGGLVYTHRWQDPEAAIAWAGEIADAERQQFVLNLAAEAYLRKDRGNAEAWLPQSGLSAEAQQRLFDRIDGK